MELPPDPDRTGMVSALRKLGSARALLLALSATVIGLSLWSFVKYSDPAGYRISGSTDISGTWDFYNGPVDLKRFESTDFPDKVEVPASLPTSIRKSLRDEFWYRKDIQISPGSEREIALALGSIKGANEVYWNGKYIGAGGVNGFSLHKVPRAFIKPGKNTIHVRVKRSETIFPGIVHLYPVLLVDADQMGSTLARYYFEIGVKPLIPGILKAFFFVLFAALFLSVPQKREYLSFSLFTIAAAFAAVCYSRFLPFYEDFYLRNALTFAALSFSFGIFPLVAAQFVRWPKHWCVYAGQFGFGVACIFWLACLFARDQEARVIVYRMAGEWMPLLTVMPAAFISAHHGINLAPSLKWRRFQLFSFAACSFCGSIAWSTAASSFLRFEAFFSRELLDLILFSGLASAMVLDFRIQHNRSQSAGKLAPKWFNGFLSTGVAEAKLELPLIALAVDTVGYTKLLSSLGEAERNELHAQIREIMSSIPDGFSAEKLSDQGDGAIFVWEIPAVTATANLREKIIGACARLNEASRGKFPIRFRMGLAAGTVVCEMREGNFSFLGHALNTACRLESMAQPGIPLVDASLMHFFEEGQLGSDWVEAELKGVVYRGRPMKSAA